MILNDLGYPKPTGASDWEDSSHLAGILAMTGATGPFFTPKFNEEDQTVAWVPAPDQSISCMKYLQGGSKGYRYVRVYGSVYNFSRDQFILLAAGLYKEGHPQYVNFDYVDGRDIMPPSVHGMVRIIKGGKPRFYEKLWFNLELWYACLEKNRTEEPFQIIAMCEVYGLDYYKKWVTGNPQWRDAIKRYFCEGDGAWRDEPELAAHVIKYIEEKCALV